MNYYEETLAKVKKLVNDQKYEEALKIIDSELTLPYVPKEFENELKEIESDIFAIIGKPEKPKLTGAQIFALLNDEHISITEKVSLFSQLETINLRNFLAEANAFFQGENPNELKTILIYLLANQEIDYKFNYQVNHQQIEINPKTFNFDETEKIIEKLTENLDGILPLEYPQLEQLSQIVIANFYYKVFPLVENFDLEKLSQAILNRLLMITGIEQIKTSDSQIIEYENLLVELEIV